MQDTHLYLSRVVTELFCETLNTTQSTTIGLVTVNKMACSWVRLFVMHLECEVRHLWYFPLTSSFRLITQLRCMFMHA